MNSTEPVIARLSEAKEVSFGPAAFYRRLMGGGDVPLVTGVQTCQPGYSTALHSHPYVEMLFVLEGESIVWQEGREEQAQHLLGRRVRLAQLATGRPSRHRRAGTERRR